MSLKHFKSQFSTVSIFPVSNALLLHHCAILDGKVSTESSILVVHRNY